MEISRATDTSADGCTLLREIQCPSALIRLAVPKTSLEYRDLVVESSRNNNGGGGGGIINEAPSFFLTAAYQNGTCEFIELNGFGAVVGEPTQTSPIPTRVGSVLEGVDILDFFHF
jgi:hypothetical protein